KFYPPIFGGIEQVAQDITEGMQNLCNVDVLSVNNSSKTIYCKNIIRASLLFTLLSTPVSISYILIWSRIRNNYDIIHVHLPNPLAIIALLLFPPKAPVVVHWHSDIVKQKIALKFFQPLQNLFLNKVEKIIVTSEIYGSSSPQLQRFQDKIICIPIGIKSERLPKNETLLKHLKEKYKNKKIVFSLGRLVYYKGFENLVNAANFLPEDTIILIGGCGELYDELADSILSNKLEGKVVLLGEIKYEQLSAYYQVCDVFCLPSIHESEAFGVVQIEAMSYGKPVVSTNIKNSGVPWVNENGISGVVVEPNEPHELAKAILTILNNPAGFSLGALERYRKLFTRDKMISSLIGLYQNIKIGNEKE
ncbi:TPA: glycosyltransferase, partial [Escherichia coli]|nr:glycosyltransferase [Escherichia coli]